MASVEVQVSWLIEDDLAYEVAHHQWLVSYYDVAFVNTYLDGK